MDFRTLSIERLVDDVRARRVSARELTDAALANIERWNPEGRAFCEVRPEDARAHADAIDARLARGDPVGPLAGVPIGVKDLEDVAGYRTTYGSALHTDDPPALADSVLVARLKRAGCVVVGKTNTPEFGYKAVTDNRPWGFTRNPWNMEHTAGGSSGGSSAAIAAGLVPLATGSDGGGSIRIPGALCGLTALKASQGRVPVGGANPPGSGLLTVKGPMAIRARDLAIALDAVVGDDPSDIFALPHPQLSYRAALDAPNAPRAVVWSPTMGFARVDREILDACGAFVRRLASLGVNVIERTKVWDADPAPTWFTFWSAQRARTQGSLIGTPDWEKIDDGLKPQIEAGLAVTGVDYSRAIDACHYMNRALEATFADAPLLLTPTVSGQAPRRGAAGGLVNGEEVPNWVTFTYGFNMTRNPAGTVNVGFTKSGLPIGLQVTGKQRADLSVLKALCFFEDLAGPMRFAPHGI